MKKLLPLLILLLFSLYSFAQWTQLTTGTIKNLHKLYCLSADTVIAVGDSGTIIKTVNGGDTWYAIPPVTSKNLNSVFFADKNIGVAVGDSGTILRTVNSGETWIDTILFTPSYFGPLLCKLTDVCFTTSDIGFIIGNDGSNFKTNNSGINWLVDSIQNQLIELKQIYFLNPDTGFLLAYDMPGLMLLSTVDGGISWGGSYGSPGWYFGSLWDGRAICPIFGTGIIVAGYGPATLIAGPTNNWQWGALSQTGDAFNSIFNTDRYIGILTGVGTNGLIAHKLANPNNWEIINSGTTENLNHVTFVNKDTGFIAGNHGIVLKTTSGGYLDVNENRGGEAGIKIKYTPGNKIIEITSLPVEATITLYDCTGKILKQQISKSTSSAQIKISEYKAGVYLLNIISKGNLITNKIIKQ
ncbi:MAG: T9SS type A sorting domain-containing protein [Bacteroidia bacterium]|nr:T9SS type A sorting domain-containing protein [Bacteroidia bacterium]